MGAGLGGAVVPRTAWCVLPPVGGRCREDAGGEGVGVRRSFRHSRLIFVPALPLPGHPPPVVHPLRACGLSTPASLAPGALPLASIMSETSAYEVGDWRGWIVRS
ncbi:hypothetical protein B0H11DRAFT_315169 [Mycena galericulata]|nr:hypothetical protein B0H11DRAFT_315169 [Mycena galericulata]